MSSPVSEENVRNMSLKSQHTPEEAMPFPKKDEVEDKWAMKLLGGKQVQGRPEKEYRVKCPDTAARPPSSSGGRVAFPTQ